jgi:hypothetical protein
MSPVFLFFALDLISDIAVNFGTANALWQTSNGLATAFTRRPACANDASERPKLRAKPACEGPSPMVG